MRNGLTALVMALGLAACTPRGEIVMSDAAMSTGASRTVYASTTRKIDPETGQFDSGRDPSGHYQRYVVSIPPDREPGQITWPVPGGEINPQRQFLTTEAGAYRNAEGFESGLAAAFQTMPKGSREAVVYVHGFNNTFAEGLYRFVQLSADLEIPGQSVYYSWPSGASALGYVYDRESATFARNGLDEVLRTVVDAGADRVVLMAHSMGAALMMEGLRQVALRGDVETLSHIAGVILFSPDLDVDVFREQARTIGELPQPFVIFTSRRDPALALSARITGEPARLGNLRTVGPIADLPVTVIEAGSFRDGTGHFAAATSPALIKLLANALTINAALEGDRVARVGLLPGALLTVQNATQVVLSPAVRILQDLDD